MAKELQQCTDNGFDDDRHIMASERLVRIETLISHMTKEIKQLSVIVSGNGSESHGVSIRLDRLEQVEQTRSKRSWIVGTIIATALIGQGILGIVFLIRNS